MRVQSTRSKMVIKEREETCRIHPKTKGFSFSCFAGVPLESSRSVFGCPIDSSSEGFFQLKEASQGAVGYPKSPRQLYVTESREEEGIM